MFHLVSEHPTTTLAQLLARAPRESFELRREPNFELASFRGRDTALQVYYGLIHAEAQPEASHFWYLTLLDQAGLEDFRALRAQQPFVRRDLMNYDTELIDLERHPLAYQHRGVNGVVLRGHRSDFASAWVFFLNAAAKLDAELGTDSPELLAGGTFNPASLATVDRCIGESCSRLSHHLDVADFVSAIQFDHSIHQSSGCFFVETTRAYFLLDLDCP